MLIKHADINSTTVGRAMALFSRNEVEHGKRYTRFSMWDGEVAAEVQTATCAYGYPSAVIVFQSTGEGISSVCWSPYGRKNNDKEALERQMHHWIAMRLKARATGTKNAVGDFSDIETY